MRRRNFIGLALSAALFAASASTLLAAGFGGGAEGEEDGDYRKEVCTYVGCDGGSRLCGVGQATKWEWIYTPYFSFFVPITDTFTCYEKTMY